MCIYIKLNYKFHRFSFGNIYIYIRIYIYLYRKQGMGPAVYSYIVYS